MFHCTLPEFAAQMEEMQVRKIEEMSNVEAKVKNALQKKDETIGQLQLQLKVAGEEHASVQAMLNDIQD